MSRYVAADALKQQVESPYTEYPVMIQIRKALKDFIDDAPSIDIVRCKECKHWRNTDAEKIPTASIACGNMHADDFCSYGQKERTSDDYSTNYNHRL